ncbi:hypothetical protein P1S61_39505 [Streptomyces sp. ME08-AFT2]|uniref:hypothetical protein n=1 Tax=Streptomyces sp. ME08-AFT2 TaxID=3028683 RepID=UPI0029A5CB2C|nr:hypothetical protein [Streptomyces sp. ME08-AFT2]MDX3315041.1 hypothetical protein [Streptomyces sp. ME08-AFT2]
MYGDLLFRDGQRALGKFLFISGWVVALSGMPALNRYLKANHLREGILKIFVILFIVGSFAVPGPIVSLVKVFDGTAQPVNYRQAALSLALIYIALTILSRIAEPKDHVLERLASRIQRAAVFRALANVTGIFAVVAFLGARFVATHPVPLISTGLTLVVAAAVVTHKTFARARKLCTQIHADTQTLLRDLDELDQARIRSTTSTAKPWFRRLRGELQAGCGHADEQKAALRAWDAVELGLSTPVDTGYRRIGLPFLTDEVVAEIEAKVRTAVHGGRAGPAQADLQAIQRACSGRVDVLA